VKKNCRIYPGIFLLWELIQSLGKREKQRFKEMARLKGGKVPDDENEIRYVNFFNVMASQKVFDKAQIKKKLTATTTLDDFTESCSYLYHAVLRAIQVANEDTISEIADVTTQIKILVYKGLHQHIPAIYEQAMAFASETEDFEDMIKLMRLWKLSLKSSQSLSRRSQAFEELASFEANIWDKFLNLREWEYLDDLRWVAYGLDEDQKNHKLQIIAMHPLFVNDGPCLSVKAQIRRLLIMDRPLEDLSPMQPERIPKLIEVATLIEQHPQLFEDTLIVDRYLNVVSSYGILAIEDHQSSVVKLAIQKLEGFEQYRKATDVLIFERVEELKIIALRNSLAFENADETIQRILKGLDSFGERVNRKRRFDFILAIVEIYLFTARPNLAAKLLAPFLNEAPVEDNPRPTIMLWVYYLIVQYELGQRDIMEIWASNATKYMNQHKIRDEAGMVILQFLKRLSTKNAPEKLRRDFSLFGTEVMPILANPLNRYYTVRFPIEMWVRCHLEGRRFPGTQILGET
jgi:hypothetical protein